MGGYQDIALLRNCDVIDFLLLCVESIFIKKLCVISDVAPILLHFLSDMISDLSPRVRTGRNGEAALSGKSG